MQQYYGSTHSILKFHLYTAKKSLLILGPQQLNPRVFSRQHERLRMARKFTRHTREDNYTSTSKQLNSHVWTSTPYTVESRETSSGFPGPTISAELNALYSAVPGPKYLVGAKCVVVVVML